MQFQYGSVLTDRKQLTPDYIVGVITKFIQWWNDHDNGSRAWTVVNTLSSNATSGLTVATPDGQHTYAIGVDNNGVLTTTQLT